MIKTIFTALITYLATSIDEIPVLFMLYTKKDNQGRSKTITIAYFIGTFILVALSLFSAFGIGKIPEKWIIGFIGLVPLLMGLKLLIKGEQEDDEGDKTFASANKYKTLLVQIIAITLGLGADDLGVFIPLFVTLTGIQIILMLLVFAIGTALLCTISYQLTQIVELTEFIEKYERYIVGIVFAGLGIIIMTECGTISKLICLF